MKNKFIIQDDKLIIGTCIRCEELSGFNDSNVIGGGRWFMVDRKLYLYTLSFRYGDVKAREVEKAVILNAIIVKEPAIRPQMEVIYFTEFAVTEEEALATPQYIYGIETIK